MWIEVPKGTVERIALGDTSALELVIQSFQSPLIGLAYNLLKDRTDAEVAVQETWMALPAHAARLEGDHRLQPWLCRVGRNRCVDEIRNRKNRSRVVSTEPIEHDDLLAGPPADPIEGIILRAEIGDLIDALPEAYRAVMVLRMDGFEYKEISQVLKIPEGTVKSRINYAVARARKLAIDRGWEEKFSA